MIILTHSNYGAIAVRPDAIMTIAPFVARERYGKQPASCIKFLPDSGLLGWAFEDDPAAVVAAVETAGVRIVPFNAIGPSSGWKKFPIWVNPTYVAALKPDPAPDPQCVLYLRYGSSFGIDIRLVGDLHDIVDKLKWRG